MTDPGRHPAPGSEPAPGNEPEPGGQPEPGRQEEETMTDDRTRARAATKQGEDAGGVSTLLPMLVGGLVLITIGRIAIAILV